MKKTDVFLLFILLSVQYSLSFCFNSLHLHIAWFLLGQLVDLEFNMCLW